MPTQRQLTSSPYKVNLEAERYWPLGCPVEVPRGVPGGLEKGKVESKNPHHAWRALICVSIGLPLEKMVHGGRRRQLSGLKNV